MERHLRGGLLFLLAFFGIHLLLGLCAVFSNGLFVYGTTAIERYILHLLSDSETTFNPTGAAYYHFNDICLQERDSPLLCYPYANLYLSCDPCLIYTKHGTVLASNGSFFTAVVKKGLILENVSYNCYLEDMTYCGFEEKLEAGQAYLHSPV
jgi:hypothetical protein